MPLRTFSYTSCPSQSVCVATRNYSGSKFTASSIILKMSTAAIVITTTTTRLLPELEKVLQGYFPNSLALKLAQTYAKTEILP